MAQDQPTTTIPETTVTAGAPDPVPPENLAYEFRGVQASPGHVLMTKPDGSVVEVPANKASIDQSLWEGYRPSTSAEAFRSKEGVAGDLLAEATAGLRGATGGFSDPALVGVGRLAGGDEKAEQIRQELNLLKEAYPGTSARAEVGGVLASTLAIPGGSGPATVGRIAARGALEGAVLGAGDYASTATLSNEKFSAEALASHMVKYAALGGALSGTIGAAGKAVGRAVASRAERAEALSARLTNPVDKLAVKGEDLAVIAGERAAAPPLEAGAAGLTGARRAADRASELYAKLAGKLGLADEGAVRTFTRLDEVGRRAREVVTDEAKILAEAQKAGRTAIEEIAAGAKIPNQLVGPKVKEEMAARLVNPHNAAEVAHTTGEQAQRAEAAAQMLALSGFGRESASLAEAAKHARANIPNLELVSMGRDNAKAYTALDTLKRTADGIAERVESALVARQGKTILPLERARIDAVRSQIKEFSTGLRTTLEDERVWGRMGEAQRSVNSRFSQAIATRPEFEKAFMTETMGRKVVDPEKVARYLRKVGPEAEVQRAALTAHLDATEGLARDVLKYTTPSQAQRKALQRQIDGVAQWRKVLTTAEERATALAKYKSLGASAGLGLDKTALIGWLVGGAGGAAAGKAASALGNPRTVVDVLGRAEAARRMVADRYSTALSRMAEGKAPKAADMAINLTDAQMLRLQEVAENPGRVYKLVEDWSKQIFDRAPELGTAVMAASTQLIQWLTQNLPKVTPQPSVLPSGRVIPPTRDDVERSRRKLQMFFHPEAAGDLLARSRLMREHIDTLKAMYPEHYEELRVQVTYMMAAKGPTLSPQQEMGLSILFDGFGRTMYEPIAVREYQQMYQQPAPQQAQPGTGQGAKMPIRGTRRLRTDTDEREEP